MITLFNRYIIRLQLFWASVALLCITLLLAACDKDELDIQQNFPFEVSIMPVPGEVAKGQTVEIRITIKPTGSFSDAKYFIRYFQFEGTGTLQYYNDPPYLPIDSYSLAQAQFRLYYTSQSAIPQSFDVWISDNFGNEKQLSFQFNSSD